MALAYKAKSIRPKHTAPVAEQYDRITQDVLRNMAKLKSIKSLRWQYLAALNRLRDAIDEWMAAEIAEARKEYVSNLRKENDSPPWAQ